MIRFMNLGATLSLNMADYSRGMRKAAEEARKAEAQQAKLNKKAEELSQKTGESAKRLKEQTQLIAEELRQKTRAMEQATVIEEKYAARVLEIERQLGDDRIDEIKKQQSSRIREAKKEYAALIKLSKEANAQLTPDQERERKAYAAEAASIKKRISAENSRVRAQQAQSKIFTATGQGGSPEAIQNLLNLGSSLRERGRLEQQYSRVKAKSEGLALSESQSSRMRELQEIISKSADGMIQAHRDKWLDEQKSIVAKIANEKSRYLARNQDKIDQYKQKLAALSGIENQETEDLVESIKKLEAQKDRYLASKDAELRRAAKAFETNRKNLEEARGPIPPNYEKERNDRYNAYATRAGTTDQISNRLFTGTAIIGGATALAIKSGAEVSRVLLREFHSTSMDTQAEADRMFKTITDASIRTGKDVEDLAVAFRKIENIVGKEGVFSVFEQSLRAAIATGSDLTEIAETTAKAINAFGGSTKDAAKYTNTLVKAASLSSIEMAGLAKISGQTFGLAQAAGINFKDATAALVTFTKANLDAHEAATQFKNSLSKIMVPSKDVIKKLEEYDKVAPGIRKAFSRESIKENGLIFAFDKIREAAKATNQDYEKLALELFPNLRGTIAGIILASEQGYENFKKVAEGLNSTFSGTEDVISGKFNRTVADASTQVDILGQSVKALTAEVSKAATPSLQEWVTKARDGVKWFTELDGSTKKLLFNTAEFVVVSTAVLGVGFKLASMYYGLRAAQLAAAESQLAFSAAQAGGVMNLKNVTGLVTTARLGWAALAVLGVGAAVIAYNHFNKSAAETKLQLGELNKKTTEAAEKAVLSATARYEDVKQVTSLVGKLKDLEKANKDTKAKEEERHGILLEIGKIMPDLIKHTGKYAEKLGLVADAQDRINTATKTSLDDIETAERNRRANEIRQAIDAQKEAEQRVSFLKGKDKTVGDRRNSLSALFPGIVATGAELGSYLASTGGEGGDPLAGFKFIESEQKRLEELANKKLPAYQNALDLAREKTKKLQESLKKFEQEVLANRKKGQPAPTPTANSKEDKGEKPTTMGDLLKMFKNGEAFDVGIESRKTEEQLSHAKSEMNRLYSVYQNFLVKKNELIFGDGAEAKARAEAAISADPIFQKNAKGIVGKSKREEILAAIAFQKEILAALAPLGKEIDRLEKESKANTSDDSIGRDFRSRLLELTLRTNAKVGGEKELTEIEKQTAYLDEVLKDGRKRRDALGRTQVDTLLSAAKDVDARDLAARLTKQQNELDALTAGFFKKSVEGDGIYNQLSEFFKRSPDIVNEMGGDALVQQFIETTKNAWLAKEALEGQENVLRKLQKAYQDTIKPFSDLDRIIADMTSGSFVRLQDYLDSISSPVLKFQILGVAAALSVARKNAEDVDKRFKDIDSSIAKARAELDELTESGDEFTNWYRKNFGAKGAPSEMGAKLREWFALDKTKDQIQSVAEKLKSLRKKAGEEDVYKLDKSGRLEKLRDEEKKLARYESRLRAFENTFKQIFSRAFDAVLLEEGNFFKSLTEGVKQAGLRLASQELANGAFDIVRGGAEKIFPSLRKPKFSKSSQDIIDNPEPFVKALREALFNENNVMQVMIVGYGDGVQLNSMTQTVPTKEVSRQPESGGGKSNPYTWQNFAGAYALSKSSQGQSLFGTGMMLKSLGGIKGMGGFGKSLAAGGGVLSQVGLAIAVNDMLGNPLGKLKKKIFGRATKGNLIPGNGYIVGEEGPEFISPSSPGVVSAIPEQSPTGSVVVQGNLIVNNQGDAETLGREFARTAKILQSTRGKLARA